MLDESRDEVKVQKYINMTDDDLVHSVCRKERLTLFNFMKMHMCDQGRTRGSAEVEHGLGDDV